MTISDAQSQDLMNVVSTVLEEPAKNSFLDIPFWDTPSMLQLLLRFGANMLICWIIIQFFYYKKGGRRDFYFTFLLFSVTVFLLIFLLDNVKLQLGFALGLFAIFGMIRYRTETVPIREMTYLFEIIGIAVINGLAMTVSYMELVVTNLIFVIVTFLLESNKVLKRVSSKVILYEKIQLIHPEKYNELVADLKLRTGLNIQKVEVGNIDFLRDVAYLKIFYEPSTNQSISPINSSDLKPSEF